jgi:hypothetical protein
MLYLYIGYEFLGFDERFYMDEESSKIKNRTEGLGWRVSLSILIGVGWLVFLILWLFFYAYPLSEWEKNVAILLMSLLVICGILGIPWAIWAIRNQSAQEKELWEIKGFKWRLWVSIILGAAVFLFLISKYRDFHCSFLNYRGHSRSYVGSLEHEAQTRSSSF